MASREAAVVALAQAMAAGRFLGTVAGPMAAAVTARRSLAAIAVSSASSAAKAWVTTVPSPLAAMPGRVTPASPLGTLLDCLPLTALTSLPRATARRPPGSRTVLWSVALVHAAAILLASCSPAVHTAATTLNLPVGNYCDRSTRTRKDAATWWRD